MSLGQPQGFFLLKARVSLPRLFAGRGPAKKLMFGHRCCRAPEGGPHFGCKGGNLSRDHQYNMTELTKVLIKCLETK